MLNIYHPQVGHFWCTMQSTDLWIMKCQYYLHHLGYMSASQYFLCLYLLWLQLKSLLSWVKSKANNGNTFWNWRHLKKGFVMAVGQQNARAGGLACLLWGARWFSQTFSHYYASLVLSTGNIILSNLENSHQNLSGTSNYFEYLVLTGKKIVCCCLNAFTAFLDIQLWRVPLCLIHESTRWHCWFEFAGCEGLRWLVHRHSG